MSASRQVVGGGNAQVPTDVPNSFGGANANITASIQYNLGACARQSLNNGKGGSQPAYPLEYGELERLATEDIVAVEQQGIDEHDNETTIPFSDRFADLPDCNSRERTREKSSVARHESRGV